MVEVLFEFGVDMMILNWCGEFGLYIVVFVKYFEVIVMLFVSEGVDVDLVCGDGKSVLYFVVDCC